MYFIAINIWAYLMRQLIENIGEYTLQKFSRAAKFISFIYDVLLHACLPSSYYPAMRMVLVKQVFFTSVQVFSSFVLIAFLFGFAIIGSIISISADYGLQADIGEILVYFIFNEFAPLFTALLIALRSGTAVNTEMAVMTVTNEINTLKTYQVELITYLYLPRILAGVFSVSALAIIFSFIMLISGYVFSALYLQMELVTYSHILLGAVELSNILMLLFKSMVFGFLIMLIPIYHGIHTIKSYNAIPISVLQGMVNLFVAIIFIEMITVLLWSL